MSRLLVLSLVAGCRFGAPLGGDAGPVPGDTPDEGQPPPDVDAPIDAPVTCMERWRAGTVNLGAPMRLMELGVVGLVDRDPFISADELTIYFSSDRDSPGVEDVYAATRPSLLVPFNTPVGRGDISSPERDTRFTMTSNGLTAVVSSDRSGTEGGSDVWMATRATAQETFGTFSSSKLTNVNTGSAELDPELSADGLHLYIARGSPQRIAVSVRPDTDASFESPQDVGGINSGMGDADPTLSADERVIVFASRRSGGSGGVDIYYTSRAGATGAFDAPKPVPVVNTTSDDGNPALSADGCRLYFASFRGNDWEIYVSSVVP